MEGLVVNAEFWRDKSVFITGHTGFKGSWLSLWLQRLGADVTGYALDPPTTPSLFAVARIGDDMRSIVADIRDCDRVAKAVRDAKPDIVIHMAAQSLVRASYTMPVETYATNVMGTVHLLEAVRRCDAVRAVVNVTSDKCYENREWVWGYRENEPMGGYDPYSSSKGCAELVTAAYRASYFNPERYAEHGTAVATARAGNVIGGGDWASDRLVPDVMRAVASGNAVVIRRPDAIRPWQHVLEPLGGYLTLAERLYSGGPTYSGGWNFGPDDADAKPVRWIAEHLTRSWGNGASWVIDSGPQPHEATFLKLDCAKAKAILAWQPRWALPAALDSIVEWQRAFLKNSDMKSTTLAQIARYEATGK